EDLPCGEHLLRVLARMESARRSVHGGLGCFPGLKYEITSAASFFADRRCKSSSTRCLSLVCVDRGSPRAVRRLASAEWQARVPGRCLPFSRRRGRGSFRQASIWESRPPCATRSWLCAVRIRVFLSG